MDGQFEPLWADLAAMGIELNVVPNDEHVQSKKESKPSGACFHLPECHGG